MRQILNRKKVYIFMSRHGVLYFFLMMLLFIASVNYQMSLGYVITFGLASFFVIMMLATFNNLSGLMVKSLPTKPVFAGDAATMNLQFSASDNRDYNALLLEYKEAKQQTYTQFSLAAQQFKVVGVPLETKQRGWFKPERLVIRSYFPVGIFTTWSYFYSKEAILVYPRLLKKPLPKHVATHIAASNRNEILGDDEFTGIRAYQLGDRPSRIAWRASARMVDNVLMTKQYSDFTSAQCWLDWQDAPGDVETRLSVLTYWVTLLAGEKIVFGLRLPQREPITPNHGDKHVNACLQALTFYRLDGSNQALN